jgi:thiamine-phosphate pyrophosphorylase
MIILISSEKNVSNEIKIVEEILIQFPEVLFHLRKPQMSELQIQDWLKNINASLIERINVHQHQKFANQLGVSLLHQKEEFRHIQDSLKYNSTSFHVKAEAVKNHQNFDYFFCSPIFQSISKPNYSTSENWNILGCDKDFREKAVGLGGLNCSTIAAAKKLGFNNFAFLGAVWESSNPFEKFTLIHKTCQENVQSV